MRTSRPCRPASSRILRRATAVCLACATAMLTNPASGAAQQRSALELPAARAGWPATVIVPTLVAAFDPGEPITPPSSEAAGEASGIEFKDANVAARLLLEIGALGALGYWGARKGESRLTQIALGVGVPLTAAIVWGTFASPQAPVELATAPRLAVQTAIFGVSAAALADAGHPRWATALPEGSCSTPRS